MDITMKILDILRTNTNKNKTMTQKEICNKLKSIYQYEESRFTKGVVKNRLYKLCELEPPVIGFDEYKKILKVIFTLSIPYLTLNSNLL